MKLPFSVKKTAFAAGFLCLMAFSFIGEAQAQTITVNDPIRFGRFVLVDNAAGRQIELLPGGGYNADPQYIFFTTPQLGNVTVEGYGAGETLTVTVGTADVDPLGGGPANFATSNTFTNPAVVITDGLGNVTFDVGATLTSDGSSSVPSDDNYEGTFTVMVTN